MFVIHLFQTASADLQESYDWYEEQSIGLGERFINEVNGYLTLISEIRSSKIFYFFQKTF